MLSEGIHSLVDTETKRSCPWLRRVEAPADAEHPLGNDAALFLELRRCAVIFALGAVAAVAKVYRQRVVAFPPVESRYGWISRRMPPADQDGGPESRRVAMDAAVHPITAPAST